METLKEMSKHLKRGHPDKMLKAFKTLWECEGALTTILQDDPSYCEGDLEKIQEALGLLRQTHILGFARVRELCARGAYREARQLSFDSPTWLEYIDQSLKAEAARVQQWRAQHMEES